MLFLRSELPYGEVKFIKFIARKHKENSQMTVCVTCGQFGCSRPGHDVLSCRDYLINTHIRLVVTLAKRFPRYKQHELVEEALLSITEALTEKPDYNPSSITAYIYSIAWKRMVTFFKRDKIIGSKSDKLESTVLHQYIDGLEDPNSGSTVDIDDTICKCCNDRKQEFIVKCLKEGGWTTQDISKELGVSPTRVSLLKEEFAEKLRRELYEKRL